MEDNSFQFLEPCYEYTQIYVEIGKNITHSMFSYSTLNESQRKKIIKWYIEIIEVFDLSYESLNTAVYLLDKYFHDNRVVIGKIQLFSATCLLISTKYHECHYPSISEFVYLCDGLYNFDDFIETQNLILKSVQYKIPLLNARFLCFAKIVGENTTDEFLESVDYICGIIVPQIPSLTFANPDQVAEAAIDIINENSLSQYENTEPFEEIKQEISNFIEKKNKSL